MREASKTRQFHFVLLLLLGRLLLCVSSIQAQRIDSTFWLDVQRYSKPFSVVAHADGSCLILGSQSYTDGYFTGGLTRLLPNGQVDQAYQQQLGGLELEQFTTRAWLAPYADGRVLVAATGQIRLSRLGQTFPLVRLTSAGRPDSTFTPFTTGLRPFLRTVVVQPDGKILLAGDRGSGGAPILMRLLANGQLDASFTPFIGTGVVSDAINAVVVQPDGKILVGGQFTAPARCLVRLLPDGQVDPTFQAGITGSGSVQEIVLRSDGRIVLAGPSTLAVQGRTAGIQQLLPSGQADAVFQAPAAYGLISQPTGPRLRLLPNGNLLVSLTQPSTAAQTIQLLPNGLPDPTFNAATLPLNVEALYPEASGSILLTGVFNHNTGPNGPVLRLLANGQIDTQFGPQLYLPGSVDYMLTLSDGRTVLAGAFDALSGLRAGNIACLLPSGEPDTAFMRRSPWLQGYIAGLVAQPNGGIIVGGGFSVVRRGLSWSNLARLQTTGELDTTFQRFVAGNATAGIATQANNSILISGQLAVGLTGRYFARLQSNGVLDPTFVLSNALNNSLREGRHVVVQPDGRVILIGKQMHRVLPGGQVDPTFVAPEVNAYTNLLVREARVQPDGKFMICGQVPTQISGQLGTIARLLPTGGLDTTFHDQLRPLMTVYTTRTLPNGGLLVGGVWRGGLQGTLPLFQLNARGAALSWSIPGAGYTWALSSDVTRPLLLGGNFIYAPSATRTQLGLLRITPPGLPLATDTSSEKIHVDVFPNPANDEVQVSWPIGFRAHTCALFDVLGRRVREIPMNSSANSTVLSVKGLTAGTYLLRLHPQNASTPSIVRRVIVD